MSYGAVSQKNYKVLSHNEASALYVGNVAYFSIEEALIKTLRRPKHVRALFNFVVVQIHCIIAMYPSTFFPVS
jgi:hypothetical protein